MTVVNAAAGPGPITSFRAEHFFLSNFYPLPPAAPILYNGIAYRTSEAAYQAQKTFDPVKRLAISRYYEPWAAKRAGANLDLRPDWEQVKVEVMAEVLEVKFEIPQLRELLVATGERELVEGVTWCSGRYWGRCYCRKCGGVGQNMLGWLLMALRGRIA